MADENKFNIMIVAIVAIVAVVAIVLIVVGNVNVGTGTSGNLQGNAAAGCKDIEGFRACYADANKGTVQDNLDLYQYCVYQYCL